MTPESVAELVAETPMPRGYRLRVEPLRRFKYRALWAVVVFRDGQPVWTRRYYQVGAGIRQAHAWAWADSGVAA